MTTAGVFWALGLLVLLVGIGGVVLVAGTYMQAASTEGVIVGLIYAAGTGIGVALVSATLFWLSQSLTLLQEIRDAVREQARSVQDRATSVAQSE